MSATSPFPPAPSLVPITRIVCEVGAIVSLGRGRCGERRFVPLGGGSVVGPALNGTLVEGGVTGRDARRGRA